MKEPNAIIKHAVAQTVGLINKHTDPTEALTKVAKYLDLNKNYIQRVGEVVNVALHYDHFKTAADKSTDFPVVRIPDVQKAMFSEKEKTASEQTSEWFGTSSEPINYVKLLSSPGYRSQYGQMKTAGDRHESYETSYNGVIKQSIEYLQHLDKELDNVKTKRAGLNPLLEGLLNATIRELHKDAGVRPSFSEVESQVFATYGEEATPYLDLIYKSAELTEERGIHDDKYRFFKTAKTVDLVGRLMKVSLEVGRLNNELTELNISRDASRRNYKEACSLIGGNTGAVDIEKTSEELDPVLAKMRQSHPQPVIEKDAAFDAVKHVLDLYKDKFSASGVASPQFKNTANDNHERSTLLQELMLTDPILKKEDPHKIAAAYEQLLRLAPHVSKEKDVVRAHLRSALQTQGVGPFDAKQVIDLNKELMNQLSMSRSLQAGPGPKK